MSTFVMNPFPLSSLPETPCGRLEFIQRCVEGIAVVDEEGNDTGERLQLMTPKQAAELLERLYPSGDPA